MGQISRLNRGFGTGPNGKYHQSRVSRHSQNAVIQKIWFMAQLSCLWIETAYGILQIVCCRPGRAQSQEIDGRCRQHQIYSLFNLLGIFGRNDIFNRMVCFHPEVVQEVGFRALSGRFKALFHPAVGGGCSHQRKIEKLVFKIGIIFISQSFYKPHHSSGAYA